MSAGLYGPASAAQEQLQEIVVTGSRIVRQDYEAASPVVSVSAEAFKQTGVVNAEQLVNTLPQIVPSFSTGNNNPGTGQAYVNLRGIGEERTLVLVDGKRMTPASEDALVDINTIPTSMIERVEVLSGGASAVYGSDAIAGAVNFILKKDFNGVEIDGQYGISEEGDTDTGAINVTMGSDLADGRGNVVMYGSFNTRERLGKGEREFSAQAQSGTSFFPSGHLRRAAGNAWTLDAQTAVFEDLYGSTAPSALTNMSFNDDQTMFAGTGLNNFREVLGEGMDGLFFAQNFPNGPNTYSYNFEPWNNLVLPQNRFSMGAFGNFAITDNVEAYTRIMYTNYSASTQLAPSPAPTGANVVYPDAGAEFVIPVSNPWVQSNPGVLALANSRTGDNVGVPGAGANEALLLRYRFVSVGPRKETYNRDQYQMVLGTRGDINDNWNFDVYAGHGKFNEQLDQDGNISVTKAQSLLDDPLGGETFCEGGWRPFGFGGLSPACAEYVSVGAKNTAKIEHNMAEAVVSGDLFNLPAGSVGSAFGVFWQDMSYRSLKDEILRSGDVSGFNAEDNITGRVANTDLFAELYFPLLSGLPGVELLGLTVGYRWSDHNVSGNNSSYKAELDWNINDALRVRGGYQRAVRAPNIAELFQPQVEDNPEVRDPCNFDSAERAGPNAAQVRQLCLDQGVLPSIIDTYKQGNDQIDALQGGNPDLFEESADTYTVGVVWQPQFADRLSMSLDYFNIEITDAISSIGPETIVARCFNADDANPNYELDNYYCNLFGRFLASNEIQDLLQVQQNLSGIKADGFDLQIDWGFDVGRFGDIGLNLVTSFTTSYEVQETSTDPFLDYTGTIGSDVGEAIPDWKGTLTGTWNIGSWSTALRIRHVPAMDHELTVVEASTDPDVCGCVGVGASTYVDLSTRWQATDALSFRLGVENLTNEDPQLYDPHVDSGTDPSVYDVIGRRYFLNATYKF